MRRLGLMLGLILFTSGLLAQEENIKQKFIKETRVEAPLFIGDNMEQDAADFNKYLVANLSFIKELDFFGDEGIVVVQFEIDKNGAVVNAKVTNSVSRLLDDAVLKVVNKSTNQWMAGKVNGEVTSMDKTIYVKFDVPGNQSHLDMARSNLEMAIKQIILVDAIDGNLYLSENQKSKKINRRIKVADYYLSNAEQFKPDDLSILFWQARVCELQGNEKMMNDILKRYVELAEEKTFEEQLLKDNQLAVVQL
nr:TonB family protein [uncultured Carboxylicivirga sp.]